MGQCSAGPHKPGPPSATLGPATTGYANWHSGEVESLVPVGSSPTPVTDTKHDPVVQRQRRLGDSQEDDGSSPSGITRRSVGVPAAHLLGKEEDRVRFPNGPLKTMGWHVPRRRLTLARSVWRVRLPHGPLNDTTKWRNWQTRDAQNVVPQGNGSSNLPLVTYCRRGRCPTGFHTAGAPGSIPGPATAGGPVLSRAS